VTAVVDAGASFNADEARLADAFQRWLETGIRTDDLFAANVLGDLTVPHWRVQAVGPDATFRLREDSHPYPAR
jgi:hypothetical protein